MSGRINLDNMSDEFKSYMQGLETQMEQIAIDVKHFGVKGDGITDDTQSLKNILNEYKTIYFSKGDYLISDSLIFEHHNITMHKEARILKSFDGVGVFIVGGSGYTTLIDFTIEGHGEGRSTKSLTKSLGHGIVVVGSRVEFNNVTSSYNKGDGVVFQATTTSNSGFVGLPAYSCNMNKCIINCLTTFYNDGCGIVLKGAQDDMSVWRCNFYTHNNMENGIKFETSCTARQFEGFIYSENDGLKNDENSHNILFDGIKLSYFTCYAEGQNNINAYEIYCAENSSVEITTLRNNRDRNKSINSSFKIQQGYVVKNIGDYRVNSKSDIIKNSETKLPNTTSNSFFDIDVLKHNDVYNFKRIDYNGIKNVFLDKLDNTAVIKDFLNVENFGKAMIENFKFANGTIDNPSDVNVGDVIYSQNIYGYKNNYYRCGGKIEVVVSGVSTGKLATDLVFYNANFANEFTEVFRVNYAGQVIIKSLAGDGDRPLMVSSNGALKV